MGVGEQFELEKKGNILPEKQAEQNPALNDLLDCPFCGGKAKEMRQCMLGNLVVWIQCINKECGASAYPKAWNKRACNPNICKAI